MTRTSTALLGALATLLAPALGACAGGQQTKAEDPAASQSSPAPTEGPDGASAADGPYPSFGEETYTYRLEVLCYCPLRGPVALTVEGGTVTDAAFVGRAEAGAAVPDSLRLTIDDIIARANDPAADKVSVRWPEGQAWPSRVSIDRRATATDDEVTYLIRDVRVR